MIHYVGEIIVSDCGICKVIDVDENGIYTAETIIPKYAFIEAFEKYLYNPTVITCKPLSNEETEKLIKTFQSGGIVPDNLQGWRYEETPQEIPTFNREELEKARDYWYNHLEVGNEEQNEAAWAAINAIKYCIEHSSGYQKGAEND